MNAHASISYEDRLKAEIKARRGRTGFGRVIDAGTNEPRSTGAEDDVRPYQARVLVRGKRPVLVQAPQVANIEPKPVQKVRYQATPKPHDAHYHAWLAWRSMSGIEKDQKKFFTGLCLLAGVSMGEVQSRCRDREIVLIRVAIARSMATQFPNILHKTTAGMMNRDRSTVAGYLGGALKLAFSPFVNRASKVSGSRIPVKTKREMVRRYRSGENAKTIAGNYGVDISTVYTYVKLEKEGNLP